MKPANIFINGDWSLSQSGTTLSRRGDLEVPGTAELKYRKSISQPTMLERGVSKRIFEGIHDRFQKDSTYPQLKIGWAEETCIAMDK